MSKLTDEEISRAKRLRHMGMSFRDIAEEFGTDRTTILAYISSQGPSSYHEELAKGRGYDSRSEYQRDIYDPEGEARRRRNFLKRHNYSSQMDYLNDWAKSKGHKDFKAYKRANRKS